MFSTLVRAVAATATGLTLLDTVKNDLNISGTAEDDYINEAIDRVSSLICSQLKVTPADDGSRTLASEDLIQTFRVRHGPRRENIVLARKPVTSVAYVKINDVELDPSEWEIIGRSGILARLRNDLPMHWPHTGKIEVRFTAGWLLPDKGASRTLPPEIEGVAVDLIKSARAGRTRDPLVRSVEETDVETITYWVGSIGQGPFPADLAAKIEPYRYRRL